MPSPVPPVTNTPAASSAAASHTDESSPPNKKPNFLVRLCSACFGQSSTAVVQPNAVVKPNKEGDTHPTTPIVEIGRVVVAGSDSPDDYVLLDYPNEQVKADTKLLGSLDTDGQVTDLELTPGQVGQIRAGMLERGYGLVEVPEELSHSMVDLFLSTPEKENENVPGANDAVLKNQPLNERFKQNAQSVVGSSLETSDSQLRQLTKKGGAEKLHRDRGGKGPKGKAVVVASTLVGDGTIMVKKRDFNLFKHDITLGVRKISVSPEDNAVYEYLKLPKNHLAIFFAEGINNLSEDGKLPEWIKNAGVLLPDITPIHASPDSKAGVKESVKELVAERDKKGLPPLTQAQIDRLEKGRLIALCRYNIPKSE